MIVTNTVEYGLFLGFSKESVEKMVDELNSVEGVSAKRIEVHKIEIEITSEKDEEIEDFFKVGIFLGLLEATLI